MSESHDDATKGIAGELIYRYCSKSIPLGPSSSVKAHIADGGKGVMLNYTKSVSDKVGVGAGLKLESEGPSTSFGASFDLW